MTDASKLDTLDRPEQRRLRIQDRVLNIGLICLFGTAAIAALDFSQAGKLFPLAVSLVGLFLSVLQLLFSLFGQPMADDDGSGQIEIAADLETPPDLFRARLIRFIFWVSALFLGIWLLGFKIAVPLYMAAYLRVEAKAKLWLIFVLIVLTIYLLFYHFSRVLGVVWPEPLIAKIINLPGFLM